MKRVFLDSEIALYQNNNIFDALSLLNTIENNPSIDNVWSIASNKNINNTDLNNNSKIFYLKDLSSTNNNFDLYNIKSLITLKEKNIVKFSDIPLDRDRVKLNDLLNEFALPFILDYLDEFEENRLFVKPWSICKDLNNEAFHSDISRNDIAHKNTIIIFLNEDYSGGGMKFNNRIGNELVTFKKGDVLIYPSNEDYLHKVYATTNGTQYVAIAYF